MIVTYKDYVKELKVTNQRISPIKLSNMNAFKDEVRVGLDWPKMRDQSLEEAESFAIILDRAIEEAKNFKYNGYGISL